MCTIITLNAKQSEEQQQQSSKLTLADDSMARGFLFVSQCDCDLRSAPA